MSLKTISNEAKVTPPNNEGGDIQPQEPKETPKSNFDFPTEIVKLPSKGLVYPPESPLSKGEVEVKYMTAKEEDILSTQSYLTNGLIMDKICESVIVTPGVKYEDMLVGDRNAIVIAARMYGYGPEYKTSIVSPEGKTIPLTVDLSTIGHTKFDESMVIKGQNLFEFKLPASGRTIKFKLQTVGDQKKINADIAGLKKHNRMAPEANLTTRLRFMIQEVDGRSDSSTINKFVQNMLALDTRALREHIQKIQPDIDLMQDVEDPDTGEIFRSSIRIGLDIFYPDFEG